MVTSANRILEIAPPLWSCRKHLVSKIQKRRPNVRYFTTSHLNPFKKQGTEEAEANLQKKLDELLANAKPTVKLNLTQNFKEFTTIFKKFLARSEIVWDKLEKLPDDKLTQYSRLKRPSKEEVRELLSRLVVVKLNGGLGGRMGCKGPKSLIVVKDNKTFLDITIEQVVHLNEKYEVNVPLVLMNSFHTNAETDAFIKRIEKNLNIEIHTFNQSAFPLIDAKSLTPIPVTTDINLDSWYPSGDGNFFVSFYKSGLLAKYIKEERKVCFVSNIDNLGATVDVNILSMALGSVSEDGPKFIMEVAQKTKCDAEYSTVVQYEERERVLDISEVSDENKKLFKNIKEFKYTCTNNFWIDLVSIEAVIRRNALDVDIVATEKEIEQGSRVYQLETAISGAIRSFEGTVALNVPRRRFLPIRNTADLLLLMSDLYELKGGTLVMSRKRGSPTVPVLKLGKEYFGDLGEFNKRFKGVPNIAELDHLTASGDIVFGKDVILKGTVIIMASHGNAIEIPNGAILEDQVVSGNLRLLKTFAL